MTIYTNNVFVYASLDPGNQDQGMFFPVLIKDQGFQERGTFHWLSGLHQSR
jgi:hypothetical protein